MYELIAPRHEATVAVREGRKLSYADFGSETGRTFVWLHGTPGGRRQVPEDARAMAAEHDLRIIGVDRPGIGLSTSHRYASILDFVADLTILLDQLDVERFAIVGLSGGGPYSLATAYAMPERVVAAGILGGVAPHVGDEHIDGGLVGSLAGTRSALPWISPPLAKLLQLLVLGIGPFGPQALDLFAHFSPEGDQIVLRRDEIKAMFLDDFVKNGRRQAAAPFNDLALFLRPWGFSVRDITVPVRWWHGDADHFVPLGHAEHLVSFMPDAKLFVRPGESHLGGLGAAREVLTELLAIWE